MKSSLFKYLFQLLSYILFLTPCPHILTFTAWFNLISYVLTYSVATVRFSYICFLYVPQLFLFTFRHWCRFTPVCHSKYRPSCRDSVSAPWGMQFCHLASQTQQNWTFQKLISTSTYLPSIHFHDRPGVCWSTFCYFLLIHHSAAWAESNLWLLRLCFTIKTQRKIHMYFFEWASSTRCSHINHAQMRVWISLTAFATDMKYIFDFQTKTHLFHIQYISDPTGSLPLVSIPTLLLVRTW